jgi:hypothetical protein
MRFQVVACPLPDVRGLDIERSERSLYIHGNHIFFILSFSTASTWTKGQAASGLPLLSVGLAIC